MVDIYVDHHSMSTVAGLLFFFFYNRDVKQILFLAMLHDSFVNCYYYYFITEMLNNFKKVHREQESKLFITPFIKPYSTSSEALLIISPWMLIFWDDACFYKQSKCYKIFIWIITPSLNWTTKNGSWY